MFNFINERRASVSNWDHCSP